MLVLQNLIYAVPIVCLVFWNRLLPDPARANRIVTCIKLFAVAAVLGALWEYGSSLVCDGYGQPFFSPVWQITSYLPIADLAVNIPLYILVFSLGRTFSMREDDPAADAVDPGTNAS
ncbi:mll0056 [Mesorhizobium japonicum MAFF 303099]|nr:mll0056 [Mesorhizobium japonicum MAFF 303099]